MMIGVKRICSLFVLFLLTSAVATEAQAGRSWIFGMDSADLAVAVPARMCVYKGQTLRFLPDALDQQGNRYNLPINSFVWRYTRSNGIWNQWDSRFSRAFYPFRFNNMQDSVLIDITFDMGARARLQMVAPGHVATQMMLVDQERDENCTWGPRSVYVDGPSPPDVPITPPSDDNILICGDVCLVGAKCGDGCPAEASCETNFDGLGKIKFHKVLACHAQF